MSGPLHHFDDNGEAVPIADIPAPDARDEFEDALLDAELTADEIAHLMRLRDSDVAEEANRRAAQMVRELLMRLDGTAAAVALRFAVLGAEDASLREQAKAIGVSQAAISKQVRKIKTRVGLSLPATGRDV